MLNPGKLRVKKGKKVGRNTKSVGRNMKSSGNWTPGKLCKFCIKICVRLSKVGNQLMKIEKNDCGESGESGKVW